MRRVLIANRGEIAVRIARACRESGLGTVAVHSDADAAMPHVRVADEAVRIGPAPARESYLCIDALLAAARTSGADAVHPGYGFLAENAAFARAVDEAGLIWIGPPPAAIAAMGDKVAARATVARVGVPVVPGADVGAGDAAIARRQAAALGYPVLVKAAAGGGGKGMRAVHGEADLDDALAAAAREAAAAFGDDRVYLEKLIERPRHVEVQVLGDRRGALLHLGERECSVQRRHQKVIEEAPCPVMTPALRGAMTEAALAVARAVDYHSAGTVEFLLAPDGQFYFLEMNTRLQVEHPVTEWTTGIDLVAAQLRVARGEPLGFTQDDVVFRGHAIEVRVCAENPGAGFLPSAGPVLAVREPAAPGVRVDSGIAAGVTVPVEYDPLLAKLSACGASRAEAARRLEQAVRDTVILGPATNLAFLRDVLRHPAFLAGETHIGFLDQHFAGWGPDAAETDVAAIIAALAAEHLHRGGGDAPAAASPWAHLGRWRLST